MKYAIFRWCKAANRAARVAFVHRGMPRISQDGRIAEDDATLPVRSRRMHFATGGAV
jgi:uncharacterized protein YbaA (DUF1428 family)